MANDKKIIIDGEIPFFTWDAMKTLAKKFGKNCQVSYSDDGNLIFTVKDGTRYKVDFNGNILNKVGFIVVHDSKSISMYRYNSIDGCNMEGLDPALKLMIEEDGDISLDIIKNGKRTLYMHTVLNNPMLCWGGVGKGKFFYNATTFDGCDIMKLDGMEYNSAKPNIRLFNGNTWYSGKFVSEFNFVDAEQDRVVFAFTF
jgi:hypothetical protein